MNRYVVDGVLADMRAGLRIVVIRESGALARDTFEAISTRVQDDETVRRSHGNESIEHPSGGRIWFHTLRSPSLLRGWEVDSAFVDADVTPEQVAELGLAAREVIRR